MTTSPDTKGTVAGAAQSQTFRTSSGLFARQSTGLVRSVTGKQAIILNIVAGFPAFGIAVGIFFGLAGFPKGNYYVAIPIALVLSLAISYAFGLQSAVMPRSGGDYMIVSRVLHPALGLVSTCCMVLAQVMSIASLAFFGIPTAIAPAFQTVALVAHSHTLFNWGVTLTTSHGWQFGIAAALIVVVGGLVSIGWTWARRIIVCGFAIGMAGLVFSMVVELFTSHGTFVSAFNSFAAPFTHDRNSYSAIVAAGTQKGDIGHGFSFGQTLGLVGVISSFGFFAWNSAFIAGEVREGSTLKTAHRMGLGAVWSLGVLLVAIVIFFHTWGHDFLASAFGGAYPSSLGGAPSFTYLTSAQLGSTPVAVILSATSLVVFPVVFSVIIVVMSRVLFAWAFDGIFPRAVTNVNRNNAPYIASWLLIIASLIVLVWQVFVASSLPQVFAYTTLIQFVGVALVGVAAIVIPYRRRALYQASVSTVKVAGIPLVSIVGVGTVIAVALTYYLYFHYPYFGISSSGGFFIWLGGTVVVGVGFYLIARRVRARQGVNLDLVYAEIPPE
jgi:basic amino acid/polyamine antiporter, APA family